MYEVGLVSKCGCFEPPHHRFEALVETLEEATTLFERMKKGMGFEKEEDRILDSARRLASNGVDSRDRDHEQMWCYLVEHDAEPLEAAMDRLNRYFMHREG